jgi:ABC-type transport system involved in cytochrome c biogenesis permease subunit
LIYCKSYLTGIFRFYFDAAFTIIQIFKETKLMRVLVNTMHIVIAALFVLHTLRWERWFISGHAPWSNAYEAIVYVARLCFGLAFDIKSKLTVASAAFVSAILSAAYMNWIDPEIANLQPVLNSYWLMICCYCRVMVHLHWV